MLLYLLLKYTGLQGEPSFLSRFLLWGVALFGLISQQIKTWLEKGEKKTQVPQ